MEFEQAMKRLSEISEVMSGPELPLEQSMKLYGEAAELVRFCKEYIESAKLKVEQIDGAADG